MKEIQDLMKKLKNNKYKSEYFQYYYPKEELLKRYTYLYNNKELVLALCIRKDTDKENIENKIIETKNNIMNIQKKIKYKIKKEGLELLENNHKNTELELLKKLLEINKKNLIKFKNDKTELKCYLSNEIDNIIVDAFEEFLFTDNKIENTSLYKHIEEVKKNELFMSSTKLLIEELLNRRETNILLKGKNPFTVWKILTYVRNKNQNNIKLLNALDKYYNLDRYIIFGINSESGYELNNTDLKEYINNFNIYSLEQQNSFEKEDNYFEKLSKKDASNNNKTYKTLFMMNLDYMPNISLEEKKELYYKLNKLNKRKIKCK